MEPHDNDAFEALVQRKADRELDAKKAAQDEAREAVKNRRKNWIVLGVLAVVVIGLAAWVITPYLPFAAKNAAVDACHSSVERRLKDPSTASYSGETAIETSDNIWEVSGTVRSTNSFGAVVPASYSCTVHTGDMTMVIDMSIE